MGGRPELGRNRPLSSADAGVAVSCSDPPVDGGATDEEDWGAWGGGGVEGADSGGFAGLAATNQAGTEVGLPERVPMGPAGGVWLGSAGTRLKADLVVCSGVGPLGSRRAAMPARQATAAHLAPYGRAGAEAAWARCCIVGAMLQHWLIASSGLCGMRHGASGTT